MEQPKRRSNHRRRNRHGRRRRVYSPPVEDEEADMNCGSGLLPTRAANALAAVCADTADVTCSSPQDLYSAAAAQRFDKALLAGVNEVAQDLQELFQKRSSSHNNSTVVEASIETSDCRSSSSEVEQTLESLCCGCCGSMPVWSEDRLCFDVLCEDCEHWEEEDEVLDQTLNTTLNESIVTKVTQQSLNTQTDNTVETTEIETFLDSRWTPTPFEEEEETASGSERNSRSASPSKTQHSISPFRLRAPRENPLSRKTILMQRQVRHIAPFPDCIITAPKRNIAPRHKPKKQTFSTNAFDERNTISTSDTTTAEIFSSPGVPLPKPRDYTVAAAASPTSVMDDYHTIAGQQQQQRRYSGTTGSSVDNDSCGTKVHSNSRAEAIAQADALVRAMVQQHQEQVATNKKRQRFRHIFRKLGEI